MQIVRKIRIKTGAGLALCAIVAALLLLPALDTHGAVLNRVPDRLVVKPKAKSTEANVRALFAAHSARQLYTIRQIDLRIIQVPSGTLDAILAALKQNANVEFAEPDFVVKADAVPNDPYYVYNYQWHLAKIAAPSAWDITTGSSNVIVAILDTGIDSTHPDMVGNLVPGWNVYGNNPDTTEVYRHGTAVAGTVAAMSNNGIGVASIAWGCKLMPIRVSDTNGFASSSVIANGLTYAADQGARVANISFGVTDSSAIASAAQYFQSKGGVVTVSAGNEGFFNSSADNPYVLTVSATDSNDALPSFSNTGNNIDLSAPGVSIMTAGGGGIYVSGTGTSFSAPVVAGVAALVISANPSLTGAQVQEIIKQSTDDLGTPGWDSSYGWGRVNALKAVQAAIAWSGDNTNPPPDIVSPTVTIAAPAAGSVVSGNVTITVSATDNVGVTQVECYINNVLVGTSTAGSFAWDTTALPNGSYSLQGRARDAAGNVGLSANATVTVQNSTLDVTAPVAQITSPAAGATVSGSVSVGVSATDNIAVTRVEWFVNGVLMGSSSSSSALFTWDTRIQANGSYTLQARAYDAAGNTGNSATRTVSVQNVLADVTPPTVQIVSPGNGAVISGKSTQVSVAAADNVGVTRVDLLVDGKFLATSSSATPVFAWNTSKLSRGSHSLQAVAYDAAGNLTRSAIVSVRK